MAVGLSTTQFQVCQEAYGQFVVLPHLSKPLANPTSNGSLLYMQGDQEILPHNVHYK